MENIEMLEDAGQHLPNREIWYESKDPDFIRLCEKSRVTSVWMSYWTGVEGKYQEAPIKPISNYVSQIGYEPSLVSINGNIIRLRFYLYADIYLLKESGEELYHVDRPWVRQYYLTNHTMPEQEDCFEGTFKFYVPWCIDDNVYVRYMQPSVDSPFIVENKEDFWYKVGEQTDMVRPHFVHFKFKKIGSHMEDEELGIPRRGDPIFDMEARVSDIMVERIKEYYANN